MELAGSGYILLARTHCILHLTRKIKMHNAICISRAQGNVKTALSFKISCISNNPINMNFEKNYLLIP